MSRFLNTGKTLIAEPFISDLSFFRKVVVMIEDNEEGSLGAIINDITPLKIRIENEEKTASVLLPLCLGGPVGQKEHINFIHPHGEVRESIPIGHDLFWGGNALDILQLAETENINLDKTYAVSGYCGWGPGQLYEELKRKTWIPSDFHPRYLSSHGDAAWTSALKDLGGTYRWLANAPMDVNLN